MSLTPPIFAEAAADPAVVALFQEPGEDLRIYPTLAPDGTAYPYARWKVIDGDPQLLLSGAPVMDSMLVQFNIYGATFAEAKAATLALRTALERRGDVTRFDQLDDDPDTGSAGWSMDVEFWERR